MNKSYRSIWNESLGAWVAASEITSARGKRSSSAAVISGAVLSVALASFGLMGSANAYIVGPPNGACNTGANTGPDGKAYPATVDPGDGSGVYSLSLIHI